MFTLVSGEMVHNADTPEHVVVLTATQPARPLASVVPVPPPIAAVVDQALAFAKTDRFADARSMQQALEQAYFASFGITLSAPGPMALAYGAPRAGGAGPFLGTPPFVGQPPAVVAQVATQPATPSASTTGGVAAAPAGTQAAPPPGSKKTALIASVIGGAAIVALGVAIFRALRRVNARTPQHRRARSRGHAEPPRAVGAPFPARRADPGTLACRGCVLVGSRGDRLGRADSASREAVAGPKPRHARNTAAGPGGCAASARAQARGGPSRPARRAGGSELRPAVVCRPGDPWTKGEARMLTTCRRTILALLPMIFSATVARADDTATCNAAYEQADLLVHSSAGDKLIDAREKMRACASPTCKDWMVKDCSRWLSDLEPRIPTVVLSAKDGDGSDMTQVSVSVDGKVLSPELDGHAIEMDPGARVFVFTASDGRRTEVRATVEEGEKAQRVAANFAKPGSDGSATSPDVTPASAHPPLRTIGFVVGGVGIASNRGGLGPRAHGDLEERRLER